MTRHVEFLFFSEIKTCTNLMLLLVSEFKIGCCTSDIAPSMFIQAMFVRSASRINQINQSATCYPTACFKNLSLYFEV